MGIICGYPIGAKIVCNFYENNICTKKQAERMLGFTNNSGPLFVLGTLGISLLNNYNLGVLLLITHLLASITVGFTFGIISHFFESDNLDSKKLYNNYDKKTSYKTIYKLSDLGEILGNSINSSISTILTIGRVYCFIFDNYFYFK